MITPEEIQLELQKMILTSIAQEGLLPKDERLGKPCLTSGDPPSESKTQLVCLNQVKLKGAEDSFKLKALVTEEPSQTGIYCISLERPRHQKIALSKEALKEELRQRLLQTVVLILKPLDASYTAYPDGVKLKTSIYPKGNIRAAQYCFDELRTKFSISSDNIIAVLAPAPIFPIAKEIFSNTSVFEVSLSKHKVTLPMFEVEKYWRSKMFDGVQVSLNNIPDYEKALEAFYTKTKIQEFSIHTVRLPTALDTQYMPEAAFAFKKILYNPSTLHNKKTQAATLIQKCYKDWHHAQFNLYKKYDASLKKAQTELTNHQLEASLTAIQEAKALKEKINPRFFQNKIQ